MIWVPKRRPDEEMVPFKPGDLIVSRHEDYHRDVVVFLGLQWKPMSTVMEVLRAGPYPVEPKEPTSLESWKADEGWNVHPWVYYSTLGRPVDRTWTYIDSCELLVSVDGRAPNNPGAVECHWPAIPTSGISSKHWFDRILPRVPFRRKKTDGA